MVGELALCAVAVGALVLAWFQGRRWELMLRRTIEQGMEAQLNFAGEFANLATTAIAQLKATSGAEAAMIAADAREPAAPPPEPAKAPVRGIRLPIAGSNDFMTIEGDISEEMLAGLPEDRIVR